MASIEQVSLSVPLHPGIVSLQEALADDEDLAHALHFLCKTSVDHSTALLKTAEFIFEGGQTNASELLLLLAVSERVLKVDRQWFRFDNPVWSPQEALAIGRTLAQPLKTILAFARQAVDDDNKEIHRSIDALDKQLSKNSFLTSIVANLGCQEPISKAIDPTAFFDQNPGLVAFQDSVFDLHNSAFRDGTPSDVLSTRVNIARSVAENILNDLQLEKLDLDERRVHLLGYFCPRLLE